MSDPAEFLVVAKGALKRLEEALARGRREEVKELAILAEQQCRAIVEWAKRPAPEILRQIYAHFPDEP